MGRGANCQDITKSAKTIGTRPRRQVNPTPGARKSKTKAATKKKGVPLITGTPSKPRASKIVIPDQVELTLAPMQRWQEYKKRIDKEPSRLYLTKSRSSKLRQHLQARALIAHPGSGPAPLEGSMAEYAFCGAVMPGPSVGEAHVLSQHHGAPTRSVKNNDKDFFDVVIEHNEGPNPAWQVKTLNNRNRRDDPVLMSIRPDDISYRKSMNAREMADRVFGKIRDKQAADEARWNIDDARCLFFWGDPKANQMLIWQEPYYPGEIDLDAFEWRKQPSGGFAGYIDDKPYWNWYPRGGQLKHKIHVPMKLKRLAVKLPGEALSYSDFSKRILTPASRGK